MVMIRYVSYVYTYIEMSGLSQVSGRSYLSMGYSPYIIVADLSGVVIYCELL